MHALHAKFQWGSVFFINVLVPGLSFVYSAGLSGTSDIKIPVFTVAPPVLIRDHLCAR